MPSSAVRMTILLDAFKRSASDLNLDPSQIRAGASFPNLDGFDLEQQRALIDGANTILAVEANAVDADGNDALDLQLVHRSLIKASIREILAGLSPAAKTKYAFRAVVELIAEIDGMDAQTALDLLQSHCATGVDELAQWYGLTAEQTLEILNQTPSMTEAMLGRRSDEISE